MLKSTEIRWFFERKIPINITKILEETRLDISENRTDHYLLVQGCDNIGIKIRNSRLEIKRRRDVQPYYISKLNISGNIERWERWEWNDRTTCNEIEQLIFKDDKSPWIRVDKKRWQKKFNVSDNDLVPVPSQMLYSDLAMEITELKLDRKSWLTIGFDLFTKQDHSFFDLIIETFPVLQLEVDLKKEWSFGYPRWLSHVVM
jgi:hypothetical protein